MPRDTSPAAPVPRHVAAAAIVLRNVVGQVMMVQTFNRIGSGLILPGGLVEEDESPASAASREVAEELGLEVIADRLLVVEHRAPSSGRPSNLQFVFGADDRVAHDVKLTLQPDEIAQANWVDHQHAAERHVPGGGRRMAAALQALRTGTPVYLES